MISPHVLCISGTYKNHSLRNIRIFIFFSPTISSGYYERVIIINLRVFITPRCSWRKKKKNLTIGNLYRYIVRYFVEEEKKKKGKKSTFSGIFDRLPTGWRYRVYTLLQGLYNRSVYIYIKNLSFQKIISRWPVRGWKNARDDKLVLFFLSFFFFPPVEGRPAAHENARVYRTQTEF